jgi:hypothetical protein
MYEEIRMRGHLSFAHISRVMIEGCTPEQEQHVRQCSRCGGELERLHGALALFRESARQWSGGQIRPELARLATEDRANRGLPVARLAWALPIAAGLLLAIAPPIQDSIEFSAEAELEDTALLERVDAQLSRSVPSPMEPLLELMWPNSEAADGSRENGGSR